MSPIRIALVALLVAGITALVSQGYVPFGRQDKGPAKYRTAKLERGDIVSTVSATGTLNAVTTVQVGSQLSGIILRLYADFNSTVKQGQLLAELDPATYQATVDQAKADVEAAQANVQTATTDLRTLAAGVEVAGSEIRAAGANLRRAEVVVSDRERTLKRTQELATKRFAAEQDLDTALANRNTAAADVDSARAALDVSTAKKHTAEAQLTGGQSKLLTSKAQLAQRRAALALAEVNLARTKILSPIDGVVVSRNVDVGQTVAASLQAPTLFVIANDLKQMQIDANIDESDIGRVREKQRVEFTVDAYPEERFRGRVVQVRLQPLVTQNVVTYDTVVQVMNDDLLLRPGMTANIYVQVARADDVLRLPNSALTFNPPGSSAGDRDGRRRSRMGGPGASASPVSTWAAGERSTSATVETTGEGGPPERVSSFGVRKGGRKRRDRSDSGEMGRGAPGGGLAPRKTVRRVHKLVGGAARPVEVEVGITDGSFTELISGALAETDVVITGMEISEGSGSASVAPVNPFAPRGRR